MPAKLELEYLPPSRYPEVLNARNLPNIPIGWRPSIRRVTVSYISVKGNTSRSHNTLTIMMKALRARSRSAHNFRFIQRRFQENQIGHRKGYRERSTRSLRAKRARILRKRVQRRKTTTTLTHSDETKTARKWQPNASQVEKPPKPPPPHKKTNVLSFYFFPEEGAGGRDAVRLQCQTLSRCTTR